MMLCSIIIFLVVGFLILVISGVFFIITLSKKSTTTAIIAIISGALGIAWIISGFPLSCWEEVAQEQIKEEVYRKIVSSKDATRTKGEYFLFVGSSSEEDTYSYYYTTNNGGYKRENLESDYITIFEEDNCTPRVTKIEIRITFELWGLKDYTTVTGYNIYVPKGSVSTNFNLT